VTPNEFKSQLATLVAANRNREAIAFVQANLAGVSGRMTPEDRMVVADWMEGVEMALDLGVSEKSPSEITPV
jgi:hypothetical protein